MKKGEEKDEQIYIHSWSERAQGWISVWVAELFAHHLAFSTHTHMGASAIRWKFIQVKSLKSLKLFEFMDCFWRVEMGGRW